MKQIFQNLKTGEIELVELPVRKVGKGQILIKTSKTLISPGTERMLIEFGKSGWINKALKQPDKVKQVIDKIKTDGLIPTIEAVFNKLDEPLPLGYSNVGKVVEVGEGINDIIQGDRVVSNGPHAEYVCVSRNLCAKIPDEVQDEEAVFTVLGAVALQGIRLSQPTLGEKFIVFGLGLIGLLTIQLLMASGCPVLGVDFNQDRLKLAQSLGAEIIDLSKGMDPITFAISWTKGIGVDGAIITATAKGDEIIHQAAQSCRKRGRIILIGVSDLNLRRSDFYEKELTFQVSCSYGPGRYDKDYEQKGHDYPIGFVRWTERRNFEAVLETIRSGKLKVKDLITHRVKLNESVSIYSKLINEQGSLGIIIEYPQENGENSEKFSKLIIKTPESKSHVDLPIKAGIIGCGNFAKSTIIPYLSKTGIKIESVYDRTPSNAFHVARKFKIQKVVSDYKNIIEDPSINVVFILVVHHLHSKFICEALKAGKNVFVEKPLCINEAQLDEIINIYSSLTNKNLNPILMIGFNRRFSPHIIKIKELLLDRKEPLCINTTVNAGYVPPNHWIQDPEQGGGRIIGEGCHFIDLISFLAGSPIRSISAMMVGDKVAIQEDKMSIILNLHDGSIGTINYFANGSKSYQKETLEVFFEGKVIRMENFRVTKGYGFKSFRSFRTWKQDKGHLSEIKSFINALKSGNSSPISFNEIVNVTRASFAAVESAKTKKVISILN